MQTLAMIPWKITQITRLPTVVYVVYGVVLCGTPCPAYYEKSYIALNNVPDNAAAHTFFQNGVLAGSVAPSSCFMGS